MTDGHRGRRLGRMELAGAALLIFVVQPFLYITAPGSYGSMFAHEPRIGPLSVTAVVCLVGVIGQLVGLGWMWRIHRAEAGPDPRAWRYRAR